MFNYRGRLVIYHILGGRVIGVGLGVFCPHLYISVGVVVEEFGRIPSVYHYYSQTRSTEKLRKLKKVWKK
jgi:hypothetical protein